MIQIPFILLIGLFVGFTSLFYFILWMFQLKNIKVQDRLLKYSLIEKMEKNKEKTGITGKPSIIKPIAKKIEGFLSLKKWEKSLLKAGITYSATEYLIYRLLTALLTLALVFLYQRNPILLILAAVIGFMIPAILVNRRFSKRVHLCSIQLSEALGTMANSLRAGFSFMQAMKLISEEYPDPIGTEFSKVLNDIKYGISIEDAMDDMLKRLPHKDLEIVVNTLNVQRISGGNLSTLLETIQETIRGRFRVHEEVRTLTAQGKLSSWIITLLPIGLAIYLMAVNPEYFGHLTGTTLGIILLVVASFNLVIGWFLIQKVIRIEV